MKASSRFWWETLCLFATFSNTMVVFAFYVKKCLVPLACLLTAMELHIGLQLLQKNHSSVHLHKGTSINDVPILGR